VGRDAQFAGRSASPDDDWFDVGLQALVLGALGLLAMAAITVVRSAPDPFAGAAGPPGAGSPLTTLPGFTAMFSAVSLVQVGLLVLLALLLAAQSTRRRDFAPGFVPALRGWAPLAVAGLGVLTGAAFSAGLLLVAARLTGAWRDGANSDRVVIPAPVVYVATSATVAVFVGVAALLAMTLWARVAARGLTPAIIVDYGRGGPVGAPPVVSAQQAVVAARRRATLAKRWAQGWIVDHAGVAVLLMLAGAGAGLLLVRWSHRCGRPGGPKGAVACGVADRLLSAHQERLFVWFLAVLMTLLLALTYHTIRGAQHGVIRTLWGVTSFWPRAAQPFAPPCYAQRAVPELVHRVESLLRPPPAGHSFDFGSQSVILVGYSQGSVLAAAALEQLDEELLPRVALLTCGSPLRRLYARYFPAFFNWQTIGPTPVAETPPSTPTHTPGLGPRLPTLARHGRWHNVYRASDLIGSYVHREVPPGRAGAHQKTDVDRRILDPSSFGPPWGDFAVPPTMAHAGYFSDDRLIAAVDDLAGQFAPGGAGDPTRRPGSGRRALVGALAGDDASSGPVSDDRNAATAGGLSFR
jgi:hypothetical protein